MNNFLNMQHLLEKFLNITESHIKRPKINEECYNVNG